MNNNRGIDPYNNSYRLNIVHLYPDLLNLYGDRGNIQCMRMRCRWRGIDAQVTECNLDDPLSLASADIVLLGGGSDREQQIVCTRLQKIRLDLRDRMISNIVLKNESLPDALPYEIVGFENHGGRTYIGSNTPFGRVLYGHGNNGKDACEGVLYRGVIGTYLHGPLLPKNPHVCDLLLQRALYRKYGISLTDFPAPDDSLEREANRAVVTRFHSPLAP